MVAVGRRSTGVLLQRCFRSVAILSAADCQWTARRHTVEWRTFACSLAADWQQTGAGMRAVCD